MRLRVLSIFALLIALQTTSIAQTVRLINSTEQDWAGGIAGHSGENYTFEIEFSNYLKDPVPTMLWVGQYAFTLSTHDSLLQKNIVIQCIKRRNKLIVKIAVGTFRNEYAEREGQPSERDILKTIAKPPKPFKGKALLSYAYMGEQRTFEIAKIMTNLPVMNLP